MRKWTTEERYTKMEDVAPEELIRLKKVVESCPYRQGYHIQPPTGLLNDPNGFSYYNGKYHLFYQWFPLGAVHGLKYWYHTSSEDLIHWENHGVGIAPNAEIDSHGAYSGTAIEKDGKLYLFYTGNIRDTNWNRHAKQCLAIMDQNQHITKMTEPVIDEVPHGYTEHFRDPKVFEEDGMYYCIIGAQREDETGCAVYYDSEDLLHWRFRGEIKTDYSTFGFMWECPDYFELNGQGVFIISPQGIEPKGEKYQNIYQSGYMIGEVLNLKGDAVFHHGDFIELDRGFDFYAPQTMETPDGRRLLVGWMGLPDMDYVTDKNEWAHCLTLPRELTIENGELRQRPIQELQQLRKESYVIDEKLCGEQQYEGFVGERYELQCTFSEFDGNVGVKLRCSGEKYTWLYYDQDAKMIVHDRKVAGEPFSLSHGTERKCFLDEKEISFHVFVDTSSIEVFVNDGKEVFTSRIFPLEKSEGIKFFAEKEARIVATIWHIE